MLGVISITILLAFIRVTEAEWAAGHLLDTTVVRAALLSLLWSALAVVGCIVFIVCCLCYCGAKQQLQEFAAAPDVELLEVRQEPAHVLDRAVIHGFPTAMWGLDSYGTYDLTECTICLVEIVEGELVRVVPICGHAFLVHCIDDWLSQSSNCCPICRQSH